MMDIIICRIKYPNDPTGNTNVHQHFIGSFEGSTLELYSISSIMGKEYKVYSEEGNPNEDYYLIIGEEQLECKLRVPSFIDCTKSYILKISEDVDISKLNGRAIPIDIRAKIADKISLMKENKKLKRYCIDMNEFISINNKVKK